MYADFAGVTSRLSGQGPDECPEVALLPSAGVEKLASENLFVGVNTVKLGKPSWNWFIDVTKPFHLIQFGLQRMFDSVLDCNVERRPGC